MTRFSSSPVGPITWADAARRPAAQWFEWLSRPRRVLLALACTWVVHVFDLGFTQLETHQERFRELNPIAAGLLHDPHAMAVYKFSLLTIGSIIVLCLRRWPITEMGAWLMLASSVYVAVRWHCYYASLASGVINPFITCS